MTNNQKVTESVICCSIRPDTDLRSFGVAEPRSPDFNASIASPCLVANFRADMLAFSITIGPDEQCFAVPGLVPNVLRNGLFVLLGVRESSEN